MTGFECFITDMGQRPSAAHSVERKDTNGNYEPSNCVWATAKEQNGNKRDNHWVEIDGQQMLITDACKLRNISLGTVLWRIKKGWSETSALNTPARRASGETSAEKARRYRAEAHARGIKSASELWWQSNRDRHRANGRRWREQNIEKARGLQREAQRRRRETPWGAINNILCSLMHQGVRHGSDQWSKYALALGYTWATLRAHLERQFLPGMTWENWGDVWEVDHIIPLSTFKYETIKCETFRVAWALSNLRPLPRNENAAKGSRLEYSATV